MTLILLCEKVHILKLLSLTVQFYTFSHLSLSLCVTSNYSPTHLFLNTNGHSGHTAITITLILKPEFLFECVCVCMWLIHDLWTVYVLIIFTWINKFNTIELYFLNFQSHDVVSFTFCEYFASCLYCFQNSITFRKNTHFQNT